MVVFVIIPCQVQQSVKNQDADFVTHRMAQQPGVIPVD